MRESDLDSAPKITHEKPNTKGILLAGGAGTRLWPLTETTSKQLLPVYDKPVVYYPLATLMQGGIRDVLIISTPTDTPLIAKLLGSGERIGMNLSYQIQERPAGIAQAFIIGQQFIRDSRTALVLGDNLFHGDTVGQSLKTALTEKEGATVFAYQVSDPRQLGVVEFDKDDKAMSIEEKPEVPKSNWAVTGLYVYDEKVGDITQNLKPSARGELEITDVNRIYLERGKLSVQKLGGGVAWLDAGTPDTLLEASSYVRTIQHRQGVRIGCIEEIAFRMGYIDQEQLKKIIDSSPKGGYTDYLKNLLT